jgi:hypothetical protein
MLGPEDSDNWPSMTLAANARLLKASRLPKLLEHWNPENENPSKEEKVPVGTLPQL